MKTYEFHSALPPEAVFERLDTGAKQVNRGSWGSGYMQKKRFFFYRNGGCFRLTYTGTIPMTGFIPFSGEVRAEGTGSVITGGFLRVADAVEAAVRDDGAHVRPGAPYGHAAGLCSVWLGAGIWVATVFLLADTEVFSRTPKGRSGLH